MNILRKIHQVWRTWRLPDHQVVGVIGEDAARDFLKKHGLKFLTANFRTKRGEIDLVMRDGDCLVFVEVKTRSSESWTRPADAVDRKRRRRLTHAALDYLRLLRNPSVKSRFDIVEVLVNGFEICEIRHLPNSFPMEKPYSFQGFVKPARPSAF